ncbi:MAG TPA: hypothetical protein VGK86_15370 [Thermoanaerobaculia bacterium]|jgi:hypothetical protein
MKAGYLWLASFAIFPLIGAPFVGHPAFRRFGFVCRIVLAGGVGMVLLSATMTVWALAGWRWGPVVPLATAAVAFALRWLLRNSDLPLPARREEERSEGRSLAGIAHFLTAISLLAALAATLAARSTSPDLVLFWGPKAQQFASARTIDAAFLSEPYLEYLHVYYPPLVTNVFAFGAIAAGRFPWGAATLTFPFLLAATAAGLFGILRAEAPAPRAAAASALVVSALGLAGIHSSVAGNAEPFLLFFELLGVALLLTPTAPSDAGKLLAGLLFAGAAAAKVEGLPFVVAIVVLFLLVDRNAARPVARTAFLLLAPTFVSIGAWLAFGATRKVFIGYKGYGHSLEFHWDHFAGVASAIGTALWKVGYALPFAVPILVLLAVPPKGRRALLPIGAAAALSAFLLLTYLQSAQDPRLWIAWSAARTFSPVTALLALASFPGAEEPR